MTYSAPISEQRFALHTAAALAGLDRCASYASVGDEMIDAILSESAKFASDVFAPLNRIGDLEGARWADGKVTLPAGFKEAYQLYVDGGWAGLGASEKYGGQGLPFLLATAVQEQLTSANMAYSLCMLLTHGAVEALAGHGSPELCDAYLPKMVSGEWTGTMNLTEPQAGSDLSTIRTQATLQSDGSYRVKGAKIFISWGDHDLTDNVIHLVLARLPDAPAGTKGLSLFLIPKRLPDGRENDVRCVSTEHKLGIHASPTCTMSFGDNESCVAYIVGAPNSGMRAMFTMMNNARVGVGLQGVAIAERSFQAARDYSTQRIQGRPIAEYPDVRRMLMTMKSGIEAARAIVYLNAAALTAAAGEEDPDRRLEAQRLADLLTPISKAYATDIGVEMTSIGMQVFGGMGYVEETGVAQHYRDARIAPIYEGTNGIQALDLVRRKLPSGRWVPLIREIRAFAATLAVADELAPLSPLLTDAATRLEETTLWLIASTEADAAAGASPYLRMFASTLGAYLLCCQAHRALEHAKTDRVAPEFARSKVVSAHFFVEQMLPAAIAARISITQGSYWLTRPFEEQFV